MNTWLFLDERGDDPLAPPTRASAPDTPNRPVMRMLPFAPRTTEQRYAPWVNWLRESEKSMSGHARFLASVTGAASEWFRTNEAHRTAAAYENTYFTQYLRLRASGADERALAHPRGNARGRFYEHLSMVAIAREAAAVGAMEFVCAGGIADLRGSGLSRNEGRDVVLRSPSHLGGLGIVRAEFDGMAWDAEDGPLLVELTASSGNLADLATDLWRKQLVTMRAFKLPVPPPVLLISPHALPTIAAKVNGLVVRTLAFPEDLWDIAIAPPTGLRAQVEAPKERVGTGLGGARDPDFPALLDAVSGGFIDVVNAAGDVLAYCLEQRDNLAVARRIYVGRLSGSLHAVCELISNLTAGRLAGARDPTPDVLSGAATVHLTLRVEAYNKPLRPVLHVLTRTTGRPGELRVTPGRRPEWIQDFHKATAFRMEVPARSGRAIDVPFVTAALDACARSRVFEPSIRR